MKKILNFNSFINEAKYEADHELDRILDKIGALGIESLTPQEKKYLDGDRNTEPESVYSEEDEFNNYIDEEGNYVNPDKKNFIFRIIDVDDVPYDSTKFGISVFDKSGRYQIDEHVADMIFPELQDIEIEDLAEGEMGYYGKLSKSELINKLTSMGFVVK